MAGHMLLRRRLREARQAGGLSTRELSRLAGLCEVAASHVETGTVESPTIDTVHALARVLGVSIDWLVGESHGRLVADGVERSVEAARRRARRRGAA